MIALKKMLVSSLFFVLMLIGCNKKPDLPPVSANVIEIFPNPAINEAYIYTFLPNGQTGTLKVFDTKGKEMLISTINLPNTSTIINLSDKPVGTYIVAVETQQGNFTQNLIKIK